MNINIQRTDQEVIIKLPISALPDDIEDVLAYFRYIELGMKSQITQDDVDHFVQETKGSWWKANKERFIDQTEFEDFD